MHQTPPKFPPIVAGDGPFPAVLRGIFRPPEQSALFSGDRGACLLLCAFDATAVADRAVRYSRGERFAATYLVQGPEIPLAAILSALQGDGSEDEAVNRAVHWEDYYRLTHELKYLFGQEGTPSSWFYKNPFHSEQEWQTLFRQRLAEVRGITESMESRIGSDFEADCIGKQLRKFIDQLGRHLGGLIEKGPNNAENAFFAFFNTDEEKEILFKLREHLEAPEKCRKTFLSGVLGLCGEAMRLIG